MLVTEQDHDSVSWRKKRSRSSQYFPTWAPRLTRTSCQLISSWGEALGSR